MPKTLRILTTTSSFGRISQEPLRMLADFGVDYQLNPYGRKLKPEESSALLADVDGLIAGTELLNREILTLAPNLKVISRCGTGLDNIDLEAAAELGIRVYNTPDAHVDAVAELTLAGMLNLLRHVPQANSQLRQGIWKKPMGQLLKGKLVGIIGLGRTGKALVKLLQSFHVTVLAFDPIWDEAFAREYNVRCKPLDDVISQADILSLHLSYSPENYHLLNRERLAQMKPGAFLINCARGGLVDEQTLYKYLQEGLLAGAYLDTFEREPYQGQLTELENVIVTPHIGSYAAECRIKMEVEAVENLLRFFHREG